MGPYLFRKITGREPRWRKPSNRALATVFVTAGSLGRWIREDSIVWGTGIIRRDEELFRPAEVTAVRGPRTRARFLELGYDCPDVYGDPGILLPLFYRPGEAARSHRVGIIPHYVDLDEVRRTFDGAQHVHVIDVRRPLEAVVRDIVASESIVSSSLHGLLTSHAYGVPAAWVEFTGALGGDGTKFIDYYASASVEPPEPTPIRDLWRVEDLERLALNAPLPDLVPLRKPLLEACPFPGGGAILSERAHATASVRR